MTKRRVEIRVWVQNVALTETVTTEKKTEEEKTHKGM